MSKVWVMVADAARARLFEMPLRGANMTEIACYAYPESRSPGQHASHDRLPRTQESGNAVRHAIEPHTSLREKHLLQFAGMLQGTLQRGRLEGRYDHLVLVAPPRFLGVLRERLDKETRDCVIDELDHDLIGLSPTALRARLQTQLSA